MRGKYRINNEIRAPKLRVVSDEGQLGVLTLSDALRAAEERGLDLIEISPNAEPPVAKITDFGKFQYLEKKKEKETRSKTHTIETKSMQIKVGTGDHDLELKARQIDKFLSESYRVKIELFLRGRSKYLDKKFLEERLARFLNLITSEFKTAEGPKPSPKGMMVVIEKSKK